VLGATYIATVDLAGTTSHTLAILAGFASSLTHTLAGGQTVLANVADPNGELLGWPTATGPIATFPFSVPPDPALAGLTVFTQALHLGGVQPFALSNAQDLVPGF